MDMKRILQAMDGVATKPVEGANDMKKFLQVVTEGANPHKVTLPVQMAMQHYAEVKSEQPRAIKEVKKTSMSSLLQQYVTEVEQDISEEQVAKKELISEQARRIADRILAKENHDPHEYGFEGEMAENQFTALKHAIHELESMMGRDDDLPEWVQSKITLATDYIETVRDYLVGERGMAEGHNPDTMSPTDYNRHQQDQMDYQKRDFKRREMEHELSHEDHGQYYVVIAKNGKWEKTKAQPKPGMDNAFKMVERLHAKYPSMHLGVYDPFMKKVHNMGKKA